MLLSVRAGSAQGVVAAAGIGGDGQQHIAFGGHQPRAGGEVDVALFADGVLRAVTVGVVVGVVKQRVDGLVAFEIDDADGLAACRISMTKGSPAWTMKRVSAFSGKSGLTCRLMVATFGSLAAKPSEKI